MPPVAREFIDVVDDLRKKGTGGISAWRALARRLHELDPERQSVDNWKATINRYRRREITPREETISLFARAFGVEREVFPPVVQRQTLAEVREELADVRGRLAALEQVVGHLVIGDQKEGSEAPPQERRRAS